MEQSSRIGDSYFNRRKDVMEEYLAKGSTDSIVQLFNLLRLTPRKVLEIGCSYGWRLEVIRNLFGPECHGLDPSTHAINFGRASFPELHLVHGVASDLPFQDEEFDVLIFGHCLYTCYREDLFTIASEANRVLKDHGYLIILDFFPETPYSHPNPDLNSLFTYKMDYSKMFSWHPNYKMIYRNVFPEGSRPDCDLGLFVFKKNNN